MAVCPRCSTEVTGAKFCPECGTPLGTVQNERRERRVVSVMFVDLVGFTKRSEALDIEDVESLLAPYLELVTNEVVQTAGVVAKYTGDGAMAMFGGDVAHEDDAERAVRSALGICERIAEFDQLALHVRIGVATGEVLVSWSSDGKIDGVGDTVNTASRLESSAPDDRVLVDAATQRATANTILYEPAGEIEVKGKSEPLETWLALEPRSIVPEQRRRDDVPLVGRGAEVEMLRGVLDRSGREPSTQLLSVIGSPGIGKSRLVEELGGIIDDMPGGFIIWRQGRSLPYGEGAGFWALGEMVKAQAGIRESDPADLAESKLDDAVAALIVAERDREWITRHLRPLVGIDSGSGGRAEGAQREAFNAWRRLFEAMAEDDPTVLVFEDIHWADDGLLDFIDQLADRGGAVPLLIVCTARPELLERRPTWGGGKVNATTISLTPLAPEDTARLVGSLLDQALTPAELQQALLERSEGNPLYAQEYVRMLQDRGLLAKTAGGWTLTGAIDGLPESVQGIIAARLDTLTAEEKTLIQDAAVIGKTAWLGAICTLSQMTLDEAEDVVFSLERKQLMLRVRRSSIEGESEVRFSHALTREVAYSQIRRSDRAAKHLAAADWLEPVARGREDRSELLAHHYVTALELRQKAGEPVGDLLPVACAALVEAGHHAEAVNNHAGAARYFDQALQFTPDSDDSRPSLVLHAATARFVMGIADDEMLEAALAVQVKSSNWEAAAEIERLLALRGVAGGDHTRVESHLTSGAEFAARIPYTRIAAVIADQRARELVLAGRTEAAREILVSALPAAEGAQDEVGSALLLARLGEIRSDAGDPDGFTDIERAAVVLDREGDPLVADGYNNLGWALYCLGELDRSVEALNSALEWATRLALPNQSASAEGSMIEVTYFMGAWDRSRQLVDSNVENPDSFHSFTAANIRGRLALAAGDVRQALSDADDNIRFGRTSNNHEFVCPGLALRAAALAAQGGSAAAAEAVSEFFTAWREAGGSTPSALAEVALLLSPGSMEPIAGAAALLDDINHWKPGIIALVEGRYAEAPACFHEIGCRHLAAEANLVAAEVARAEGRDSDAVQHCESALRYAAAVGASSFTDRGTRLMETRSTA